MRLVGRRRGGYGVGRRRRTLPPGDPGSTIRAAGLNDRVRDGIGWIPRALATGPVFVVLSAPTACEGSGLVCVPAAPESCGPCVPAPTACEAAGLAFAPTACEGSGCLLCASAALWSGRCV